MTTSSLDLKYLKDPDVRLMLRVRDGDEKAFSQLVENYQDRIVGIFSHILADHEAAEDLAQEVFLRVYRTRRGYLPTAKFSTYIFHITNNLASNTRRKKGRRKEVAMPGGKSTVFGVRPEEELAVEKSALMPARQVTREELRGQVRESLESLSDREKTAILFHKFEGMSYLDIAAAMDMTEPAVKSLLARTREKLRVILEPLIR
ncbi:RNA polymerase sigma factor [Polystyrenella longa]|uniref:RNA polymerase sigma factor n=1 Tax=Polystyrenella longa TaxID=2528007 RepID=UPI0011A583AC|nr:sigma-70 family RNA polymerase sigma factor [Polystyrenella longa]